MNEDLIGRVIAGQRIESVAGRGGMGVVYRARDLELERVVAVKVIAPACAGDPAFRRRFIAESRIAASLDHPNVIPIHRAGEEDGILFLVMRFVDGDDLRTVLAGSGPLEPGRAVRIFSQVAAALDGAHAGGLVHRDVKPANILLGAGDHVYLTDFGLSKRAGSDDTRTAQLVGTVNYVAPEQIRGQDLDARSDVYALGAVLFQMLTGKVPFPADSDEAKMWAHLSEPPPKPSASVAGLSAAVDAVVARAMSKAPADRYATAGELAAAAATAIEPPVAVAPAPVAARHAPLPAPPPVPAVPRRALVGNALTDSVSVLAAALIVIAGLLFGALGLAVPLAIVVYAGGVARAYFDQDRGDAPAAGAGLSDDVRALVVRAHDVRDRIDEAIERADLPYADVSAEVDKLVVTMEQTARRATLLEQGLREAPPDAVFRRLEELRSRAQPAQQELVAALEYQLKVQRRMERQLRRFHDEMDRMLVELDTVRGNLISASASQDAYEQRQVAAGVRELRDDMGLVAKGVAEAYEDREDVSATLARVSGGG